MFLIKDLKSGCFVSSFTLSNVGGSESAKLVLNELPKNAILLDRENAISAIKSLSKVVDEVNLVTVKPKYILYNKSTGKYLESFSSNSKFTTKLSLTTNTEEAFTFSRYDAMAHFIKYIDEIGGGEFEAVVKGYTTNLN